MFKQNKIKTTLIASLACFFIISINPVFAQDSTRLMPLDDHKGTPAHSIPNGSSGSTVPLPPPPQPQPAPSQSTADPQNDPRRQLHPFSPSLARQYSPEPEMRTAHWKNIVVMFNIIGLMGEPKKAAAIEKMLIKGKILVKDIDKNGQCNHLAGSITLDSDEVPSKYIGSDHDYQDIPEVSPNFSTRKNRRESNITDVFIMAAVLYHEAIHCIQQKSSWVTPEGAGYALSFTKDSREVEAHSKDILFLIKLLDNLDETYSKLFSDGHISTRLRAKIVQAIVTRINYSYGFLLLYDKQPLPPGVTKEQIKDGHHFITVPTENDIIRVRGLDIWNDIQNMKQRVDTTLKKLKLPSPTPQKPKPTTISMPIIETITDIDQKLGLIEKEQDYFVFTSTDWLDNLANTYNYIEKSALKQFVKYSLGKKTNLNIIYEDNEIVKTGLVMKRGKITSVLQQPFDKPTNEIIIPRLTIGDLLFADSFYPAMLTAYQSDQIQIKPHSWWQKLKHLAYFKLIFPFKKDTIAQTQHTQILPEDFFQIREDLIVGPNWTVTAGLTPLPSPTAGETEKVKPDAGTFPDAGAIVTVPTTSTSKPAADPPSDNTITIIDTITTTAFDCSETVEVVEGLPRKYLTVVVNGNTYKFPEFTCADSLNYKVAWCEKINSISKDKANNKQYVIDLFYETPAACEDIPDHTTSCTNSVGASGLTHGACDYLRNL